MAKYNELVAKYASDIEKLKALKIEADAALDIAKAHDKKEIDWADDMAVVDYYIAGEELFQKWSRLQQNYQIECERLSQDIEMEYWDVPFSKPRNQGIDKFWELSGIK